RSAARCKPADRTASRSNDHDRRSDLRLERRARAAMEPGFGHRAHHQVPANLWSGDFAHRWNDVVERDSDFGRDPDLGWDFDLGWSVDLGRDDHIERGFVEQ